jgi:hypothetical protein
MKIARIESLHAEAHVAHMYAVQRQSSGGVVQQAIDVKVRALGSPL